MSVLLVALWQMSLIVCRAKGDGFFDHFDGHNDLHDFSHYAHGYGYSEPWGHHDFFDGGLWPVHAFGHPAPFEHHHESHTSSWSPYFGHHGDRHHSTGHHDDSHHSSGHHGGHDGGHHQSGIDSYQTQQHKKKTEGGGYATGFPHHSLTTPSPPGAINNLFPGLGVLGAQNEQPNLLNGLNVIAPLLQHINLAKK